MRKILFLGESCLLGADSDGARSVRAMLHALAAAGWHARAATPTLFEGGVAHALDALHPELESGTRAGSVSTVVDGLVTHRLLVTHSRRHRVPRPWESRAYREMALDELERLRPDVVLTCGAGPSRALRVHAQRLGARVVFYMAHATELHQGRFTCEAVDDVLVPSQMMAELCREETGVEAHVVPDLAARPFDGPALLAGVPVLAMGPGGSSKQVVKTFETLWQRPLLANSTDEPALRDAHDVERARMAAERDEANAAAVAGGAGFGAGAEDAPYLRLIAMSLAHPAIRDALAAGKSNRWGRVHETIGRYLRVMPDDVFALGLLAEAAERLGDDDEARALFERIVRLAPGLVQGRQQLVALLARVGEPAAALEHSFALIERAPHQPRYLALHAHLLVAARRFDESVAVCEAFFRRAAGNAADWLDYGRALATLERQDDAIAAYRRALDLEPGCAAAWGAIANLEPAQLTEADVARIEEQIKHAALGEDDLDRLHFALGRVHESRGGWRSSFQHYDRANRVRCRHYDGDAAYFEAYVARARELFTRAFFEEREGWGHESAEPIFVVGLHADDLAWVEHFLVSHGAVDAMRVLPQLRPVDLDLFDRDDAVGRFRRLDTGLLGELDAHEWRGLGQRYLDSSCTGRQGRSRFVDRMLANWMHVGLIHLMLPNARIVDVRRAPMAAGFALFAANDGGAGYGFDQADAACYWRAYADLMAHFDWVLPGRVHHLHFETLLIDPEAQLRGLLEHCGLPFEGNSLRRWIRDPASRQASSDRCRLSHVRAANDVWRHYREWLEPMRDVFGEPVDELGVATSSLMAAT